MSAPSQGNNIFHIEFQSASSGTGHHISGNFRLDIPPAAVAWNTSRHSHITNGLKEAACEAAR